MKLCTIKRLVPLLLLFLALVSGLEALRGGSSGVAMAAGGTVTVVNRTVIPLQISDTKDHPLAMVGPARSTVIPAPPGRYTLRASRLDGSLYLEATLIVNTKKTVTWDILPTESVLEIRNRTTQDVMIELDGQPLVEVAAGGTQRVDGIRPGSRQLTAIHNGLPVAKVVAEFVKQDTYLWSLGQTGNPEAGIPVLRVRNFSGQKVRILVNGQRRIDIGPADSAALVGINPGEIKVEALSVRDGSSIASAMVPLAAGQTVVWEVAGKEGKRAAVEVRNQTDKVLKVCVDGSFCLRIKPKSSTQYDSLAPGRHTFQAYDLATDRLVDALEADLLPIAPYEWTVEGKP